MDVPSPLARLVLVPALPAFHARYPDIQFDMGVSDRVVDLIGDNVDCVLRGGDINDQSLIAPCRRFANRRLRRPWLCGTPWRPCAPARAGKHRPSHSGILVLAHR